MARSRLFGPVVVFFSLVGANLAPAAEPFRYPEGRHGKGELRHVNGLPVLFVEGTPEEMGEQIAVLGVKPAARLINYPKDFLKASAQEPGTRALLWLARLVHARLPEEQRMELDGLRRMLGLDRDLDKASQQATWRALAWVGQLLLWRFPADHRRELEAIATASGLDRELVIVANTMFEIRKIAGCSTLIVDGERSQTTGPLFGRNWDFPGLGYLHNYSLVTVYRPRGKRAFAVIGFPGLVGCFSGINDAGLALAMHEVYSANDGSPKFDPTGTLNTLCYRRILEECTTVEEAARFLRATKPTTMASLAICDQQGGAVFEMTPTSLVVRRPVDHICACTNHFRCQELATSTRCDRFPILEQNRQLRRIGLDDVARSLHAVNQGELTIQTMIFEPAALRLHLGIGSTPSSAQPLKLLELASLFARDPARKQR
jgi:predicted choloylglycine hydrolase